MADILESDIKFLTGVGEKRAALLDKELGIRNFGDLLYYFPFRYVDRSKIHSIASLTVELPAYVQIKGHIEGFAYQGEGSKKRLRVIVRDKTGRAELVWFKGIKWVEQKLEHGAEYLIFGRPTVFNGMLSLVHPEIELTGKSNAKPGGFQGVYSTTEKLSNAQLGSKGLYALVCNLWERIDGRITETLPEELIERHNLMPLRDALYNLHFPQSLKLLQQAEYRIKLEELLGIQLNVLSERSYRMKLDNGFVFTRVGDYFNDFYNHRLPFELTGAQKRVVREIRSDTVSGHQMNRLLQGDVGSGKTLVALMAMLLAADNGYQSCMMVPTEILARQHFNSITAMTAGLGIEIAILTGSTKTRERREILERLENGEIHILIGTHALIEDRVVYANLAMVVIDEQHRFGVEQRARMWTKNQQPPHVLVMTATPIPRTLAMTLYGDLDVSVIDELPPNRRPIVTRHMFDSQRLRLFGFMKQEIAKGRQVYVVYPLIKESEKMDYKDLYDGFESISRDFPEPQYNIVAVHGRMSAEDKDAGMGVFKKGYAHIMVATSVIEVGVDVPNATVMVIESAERFGLSQLHQLRGRVGRGAEQSYCILMSGEKLSKEARARLSAMVETNDGFRLSELDLKLRGSGDLSGTQQSGQAFQLRLASLTKDVAVVEYARRIAMDILDADASLSDPGNTLFRNLKERYAASHMKDYRMIS